MLASGEDSMFLSEARRKGLRFYVSKETIGRISFETSTWYTGTDAKFYYGKGAYYAAARRMTFPLWKFYFMLRTKKQLNWDVGKRFGG